MMNLRKVGIGKTSTSYLPLSNAMTRKTKWTYFLSPPLYFSKNNDKKEIIAKQINF
jgi:hypothetical protein